MIFTLKQKHWCEFWLKNYTQLWENLTDETKFTQVTIQYLIIYELQTRKRTVVLDRLVGRLYKLRRQAMIDTIKAELANDLGGLSFHAALKAEDQDFWKGGFPDEGESD